MAVKKELIHRFATEFAVTNQHHKNTWWGKKYNVNPTTIKKWFQRADVKEIISRETKSFNELVVSKARKNVNVAMRELKRIAKYEKFTDVKRKACMDILGIAKIESTDGNSGKDKQAEKKNKYANLSNKELMETYDELLGNNGGTSKDNSSVKEPVNSEIN